MNYGEKIGSAIGVTLVVGTIGKFLYPQQKKLFKKVKMKGGRR